MTSFNVISSARPQVLVDEQQLQALQAEVARRGIELERLKAAMETVGAVNTPVKFMAAAMALCNELAARWKAERVGIGFLKGRYVRLQALSHTEKLTRQMQLVQDIEAAMEECLDQDIEIIVPPPKDASFVYRSTETLAVRNGPNAVISFPLRRPIPGQNPDGRLGNVVAVLTLERKIDQPFILAEIEALRLTADLFTSRLHDLYEHDRWLGAKALRSTRRGLAWVVGAKHTWPKVAAIAVAGFLAFAFFVNGTFRVEAPFEFEASEQQVIAAPYDSFLKSVRATVNDVVFTPKTAEPFENLDALSPLAPILRVPHPPSVLVTLNTSELLPKLASARAERESHLKEADIYQGQGKQGERQVALAQADKADAEVRLYQWQIDRATITAPLDGIVFEGDLRTKIGAPVRTGDTLFKIGQLDKLRAELSVSEDQVAELHVDQTGYLKTTSYPDQPIKFRVERITPVATVVAAKSVFKVRVELDPADVKVWMRPGMAGLAKVDISQNRYAWIWTHKLINWVRMKLWL